MRKIAKAMAKGWSQEYLADGLYIHRPGYGKDGSTASGGGPDMDHSSGGGMGVDANLTSVRGVGGREGDGCGGEREDASNDQDGGGDEGAGANRAAVRCLCVVCNIQLEAEGFVLIPGQGYAHRECAEEFFPEYSIAPRARQPILLVPAFGGTSHL